MTLRFIFWMPQVLHTFLGISKVPFWTHFWGSFVGYLLPLLFTAYFGEKLFLVMRDAPPSAWFVAGLATIAIITTYVLVRRRRSSETA